MKQALLCFCNVALEDKRYFIKLMEVIDCAMVHPQ